MSLKRCVMLLVPALAVILAVDSEAFAQREGRGGGRRREVNSIAVAVRDEVQQELALSSEQKTKLQQIADDYRSQADSLFEGVRELPREERNAKMAELMEQREKLAADAEKKLAEVLNADQVKRLNQIVYQALGGRALAREDVAKELALSNEQREKVATIIASENEKRRQLFRDAQGGGVDREQMREKSRELRDQINNEALAVLTDDQKQKFTALQGEKFELQEQQ